MTHEGYRDAAAERPPPAEQRPIALARGAWRPRQRQRVRGDRGGGRKENPGWEGGAGGGRGGGEGEGAGGGGEFESETERRGGGRPRLPLRVPTRSAILPPRVS